MNRPEPDNPERFSLSDKLRRFLGRMAEWWAVVVDVFGRMPEWWSVAVGAWVGTLSLLALIALMALQGQTRDILSGIADTLMLGGRGMLPGFRWYGATTYASFWLAGFFLALVLALVVRVTGALSGHDEKRRQVVSRYAGFVFIGTFFIIHSAYLSYVSGAASVASDMVVTGVILLLFSVFVLAPWFLWNKPPILKFCACLGFMGVLVCLFFYAAFKQADETILANAVSTITPALAWLVIRFYGLSFPARDGQSIGLLAVVAFLLTLMVGAAMFLYPWPLDMAAILFAVGSIPIAFAWLAWLASVLACGVLVVRRLRERLPWLGPLLTGALIVLLVFHREKPGQEWLAPGPLGTTTVADTVIVDTADAVPSQIRATPKNNVAVSGGLQLAIHADGGGLRAALFTAEVLALSDDLSCGDFGSHVFAASGVSGGSLGIATWAAMRAELIRLAKKRNPASGDPWAHCKQQRIAMQLPGEFPLRNLVYGVLLTDHLTLPLIFMLTTDFVRWEAQRGQALLDSWQLGAREAMRAQDPSDDFVAPKQRFAFAATLGESKAGFDSGGPVLLFTATDVDTGDRFVFSNVDWYPQGNAFMHVPIGVATLHSARFPLISPVGSILVDEKTKWLADGGYFDNSGAATLRDMLSEAYVHNKLTGKIVIARINGNALENKTDKRCDDFFDTATRKGWFGGPSLDTPEIKNVQRKLGAWEQSLYQGWSGVDTYMATREAHAEEEVRSLSVRQMPHIIDRVVSPQLRLDYFDGFDKTCAANLPKNDSSVQDRPECLNRNAFICFSGNNQRRAPLGWYLSRSSGEAIHWAAEKTVERLLVDIGFLRIVDQQ
ncbi:MAG: MFS transporter [Zoogloeaceae bacterium]|nr:MFS transporter [Zoogloeaceae bacterium]